MHQASWPFLLCYKATGEHIELNVFTLTLWARKMVSFSHKFGFKNF